MTTATVPRGTAPTEAGIRAAIRAHLDRYGDVMDGSDGMFHPFDAIVDPASTLWADLRPSEDLRLRAIIEEAERRAFDRCRGIIVDEATAAALAFAAEFPEAPRA
jgi:hypothetical protein